MSSPGNRRNIILLTSAWLTSSNTVITLLFFIACCDHTHSQFRLLPLRHKMKETALGLSSLLDTVSKSVSEDTLRKKQTRMRSEFTEAENFRNTRNRNSPAWLISKMHTPTDDVGQIQKASVGILSVTKRLAGVTQEATGILFLLPVLKHFAENLDFLRKMTSQDVEQVLKNFNVTVPKSDEADRLKQEHRISLCDTDAIYRLANGSCNNLFNPCWGMATEAYSRWLLPDYKNGLDAPRVRFNGRDLPNPRTLARALSPGVGHDDFTHLSMISTIWGQFITHDIILTPTFVQISDGNQFSAPNCCGADRDNPECFPIFVEDGDPMFPKNHCFHFVRSTAHVYNPKGCEKLRLGLPRNQVNQVTSFIDASTIYGSSEKTMDRIREDNGKGSMLKVIDTSEVHMLPRNDKTCRSSSHGCDNRCLLAGEDRATENPGLASLHTLWVREHNRISKIFEKKGWDRETVFQETRKIIIAMIQHITFNEFLPHIIGPEMMILSRLNSSSFPEYVYNPTINPTIMNSFAAAAFRFGHSMVGGRAQQTSERRYSLVKDLFSVDEFCDLSSDPVVRLIGSHCKERARKVDNIFATELTNHLFADDITKGGLDLLSLNIQRGRDHGLPSYVLWREQCGLAPFQRFIDLRGTIPDNLLQKLERIYGSNSVHDMDLYVAGISEFHLKGASIGPTFACIVVEQFRRLKFGDRFWYENLNHAGAFTKEQLLSIKKTKLSEIICRNVRIPEIQRNVFLVNSADNPLLSCNTILREESVDWNLW